MSSPPPSHRGSIPLTATPIAVNIKDASIAAPVAPKNTERASERLPAPTRCATCTAKPVTIAEQSPPKSHIVVETRPIAALACAPRLPTIAASIYCITMEEICATIAGTLICEASRTRRSHAPGCPSAASSSPSKTARRSGERGRKTLATFSNSEFHVKIERKILLKLEERQVTIAIDRVIKSGIEVQLRSQIFVNT